MPDTVVGLLPTRSEAELALRKLKDAGFSPDLATVSTPARGRSGHYGLKVLAGVVVGAVIGFIVSGMAPGSQPLLHGSKLATFLLAAVTGAATGGLAGALFSRAAAGDRRPTCRRRKAADAWDRRSSREA